MLLTNENTNQWVDSRAAALTAWSRTVLNDPALEMRLLHNCASTRRYFRIHLPTQNVIAMDSPPATEKNAEFVALAGVLKEAGFCVPDIIEYDAAQGFLLISDLGDELFSQHLTITNVDQWYKRAMEVLLQLQLQPQLNSYALLPYNEPFILRELDIFKEWYLTKYINYQFNTKTADQLSAIFNLLVKSALEQPTVFMHRDYHSQNLLQINQHNVGILDFQDAVRGPITYDLVSLLRDCYVAWPITQVQQWVHDYYQHALMAGLIKEDNYAQFVRWFDWMGLQRHLKALGIFARVALRDDKSHYLDHIPRTLNYLREVCAKYSELRALLDFLV